MPRPLEPEDFDELKQLFNELEDLLKEGRKKSRRNMTQEAMDCYLPATALMQEIVGKVRKVHGRSPKAFLNDIVRALSPAEKAALAGGLGTGAVSALGLTGAGGFGLATGGTAFGVAGLTGAAVATGGAGLVGAAGLYVLYRGGSAALNTEMGQSASKRVQDAAQNAADFIKRRRRDQDEK